MFAWSNRLSHRRELGFAGGGTYHKSTLLFWNLNGVICHRFSVITATPGKIATPSPAGSPHGAWDILVSTLLLYCFLALWSMVVPDTSVVDKKTISMLDVADRASVSVATVCRVLNGTAGTTRAASRVRKAVKELGYEHVARSTARKMQKPNQLPSIAVMVWGNYEFHPDVGMGRVLRGALPILEKNGYQAVVWPAKDWQEVINGYRKRNIQGALFWNATPLDATWAKQLATKLDGFHAVWVLTRLDSADLPWDQVLPDDDRVGVLAANYLLQQGHKHVGYVNCETKHLEYKDRAAGFVRTIASAGGRVSTIIRGPDGGLLPPPLYREAWRAIVDRFLIMSPRPTALFAPNDFHAMMLYQELIRRDVIPTRDVTLVSANNDSHYLEFMNPRIATVDVRYEAIGQLAAEWLIRRLSGTESLPRIVSLVDPVLISAG